jgi:hypothetical protein
MIIGVDFDNTIICYDYIFENIIRERGLMPGDISLGKNQVRDHLRSAGKEDYWTELQGYVYGERIMEAVPYSGVKEFFQFCRQQNLTIYIISHRTRYPYLGKKNDLHKAAYNWLYQQGFFDPDQVGFSSESVFFELSKEEKFQRINRLNCTHFIDDLPEFLSDVSFPSQVQCLLFDPNSVHFSGYPFPRMSSWQEVIEIFKSYLEGAGSH